MTGIILCDAAPEVTERAGLFIIETTSGSDKIAVALTQRDLCILVERSSQAVASMMEKRRQAAVIPFPSKPARKRRASSGEGR